MGTSWISQVKRKMTEFNAVDFDLAAIVDIIDVRELRLTGIVAYIPSCMLCSVLINPFMITHGPYI